jgi:NhaP-type Na+/H+ or K+/H+ antiporter
MDHTSGFAALAVFSACVIVWGLVSGRLERWDVSAPIAFVVLGVVVTHGPTTLVHFTLHSSTIRSLAEVALAIVLFADASRVNVRALRADAAIPGRLLGIGLPLTIAAGVATGAVLFGSSGLWVAAAIGAIVAPTDAALGASIMSDERVPAGVRRTLNVESGLNDGIATPFVNLFIAGAVTAEALSGQHLWTAVGALVGGTLLGIGVGVVGATLLAWTRRNGWSSSGYRSLAILALAVFSYSAADVAGVNGFVCAFVAGLAFGSIDHHNDAAVLGFTEEAGSLLSLVVWFIFGAVMLVPGLEDAGWRDVLFAVLALTVLRMVPVAVALVGTGLDRATVAFIGWFGPRGLASVVFGLLAVDALEPSQSKVVLAAITLTVALSVLLHGVSASPLAARYGSYAATRLDDGHPVHGLGGDGSVAPITTRTLRRRAANRGGRDTQAEGSGGA